MSGYRHQKVTVNNVTFTDVIAPISCDNFAFLTANGVTVATPGGTIVKTINAGQQEFISVAGVAVDGQNRFFQGQIAFSLKALSGAEDIIVTWA